MSESAKVNKCWVSVPGSSCGIRWGEGAVDLAGKVCRDTVGRPKRALLVTESGTDAELVEYLRKLLVGEGFEVSLHEEDPSGSSPLRTLTSAQELFETLGETAITGDDVLLAVGGMDVVSLCSYVSSQWAGGTPLVIVPTDEETLIRGCTTPLGIDVGEHRQMVQVRACAKNAICEPSLMVHELDSESSRMARALMVATAVSQSEKEFSALWDAADQVMSGSALLFLERLSSATKGRGHIVSSTSIAIRESARYGQDIAAALSTLVPSDVEESTLVAEGMRFAARLSVGLGKLSVDDMLAQDELLEALGLGTLSCDVDAAQLREALRRERLSRTNRFMLLVPETLGRVRLATLEDDLLREHTEAWCEAHAPKADDGREEPAAE